MTIFTISGNSMNYVLQAGEDSPIQYLEHWKADDKEISLFRKGEQLRYEVLDTVTGKKIQGPISLEGKKIEEVISYLLECRPEVISHEVTFSRRPPLSYIQRWIIDDKEVYLCRDGEKLSYEIRDTFTNKSTRSSIELEGNNIEDVIPYLLECQPEISRTGGVTFVPNPPTLFSWEFRNKKIKWLKKDKDLWEFFVDKSTKTISLFRGSAEKNCLNRYKDCEIEELKIESIPHSSAYHLATTSFKRIERRSQFDSSVPIDRGRWGVTLINSGSSVLSSPFTWGGHAAIIVEGRRKGAFFTYKAHIRKIDGKTVVSLQNEEDDIKYYQKGETWRVNRPDAKRMLAAISREAEMQEQWTMEQQDQKIQNVSSFLLENDCPPVLFDLRGRDSRFAEARVIKEYDSYQDVLKDGLEWENAVSIWMSMRLGSSSAVPYKSILLIDKNGKEKIEDNRHFETQLYTSSLSQRVFIEDPANEKWYEVKLPDNCMTWAAKKLEYCGIYLNDSNLKSFITLPKMVIAKGGVQDYGVSRLFRQRTYASEDEKLTPLMDAISNGDFDKVKALLNEEINLNVKNSKGFNALHIACIIGDARIVTLLHKKGMDIDEPADDNFRSTPLFLAIKGYHESLIRLLLELGVALDRKDNKTGNTILHLICHCYPYDHPLFPEIFIKENVNTQNNYGATPLMLAVAYKKKKIAHQLLQNGAQLNQIDKKGHTALWFAYKNKDIEMMQLLIEYGANLNEGFEIIEMNPPIEITPLMQAVLDNEFKMAQFFLKNKALVDQRDSLGQTALLFACIRSNEKMMNLLIEHGADLNAALRKAGSHPLINAVLKKKLELAQFFLQNKIPVDQKDRNNIRGKTALWYAYENEDEEMMQLLIKYGANLDTTFRGFTPLTKAVKDRKLEIARLFLQNKACVDQKDKLGKTAFWYAHKNGDQEMVKLLIEFGANFDKDSITLSNPINDFEKEVSADMIIAVEEQKAKSHSSSQETKNSTCLVS